MILSSKKGEIDESEENTRLYDILSNCISKRDIDAIVIASRAGNLSLKIAEKFKDVKLVSVSEFIYSDDIKKEMKKANINYIEKSDLPIQDKATVRDTLLMFGSGVKTAIEIATIAADKGLVSGKVISISGGKKGVDTAIVIKTSKSKNIFDPDPEKRLAVIDFLVFKNNI
jgi:hypothetical protein